MFQFFINSLIEEAIIVDFVRLSFGQPASSVNFENEQSRLFVQYLEYEGDFPLSINISFAAEVKSPHSTVSLASLIAAHFSVEVLFSLVKPIESFEWAKINSKGEFFLIKLIDSEYGIIVTSELKSIIPLHL